MPFTVPGYSYTAGRQVDFLVDYQHSAEGGDVIWRERVCCPKTYFNNRMRASIHLFDIEMNPYPDSAVYMTEQVTPVYRFFADRFPNVVGSEFLNDGTAPGAVNASGVRHEDLCALSFTDASFDALVSLDVLEHVPDYRAAFRECARVLRPGGRMMWSVPFIAGSSADQVRAVMADGAVRHLLPPEYHGNPLSENGSLCFTDFGWAMLAQVRNAGFRDAYAVAYLSAQFGYLGMEEQFLFFATK